MKTIGLLFAVVALLVVSDAAWADNGDGADTVLRRGNAERRTQSPCCCLMDQRCGWTFSLGALYMSRSDADGPVLLDTANNDTEALGGDDFDLGWAPGFEIALTRHRLFGCVDLELKYSWIGKWEDDLNTGFLDDPDLATDPPFNVPAVGDVAADYESQLSNIELNAYWRFPCLQRVRWLAGLRCLRLDEEMNLAFQEPEGTDWTYDVETENLLCGVQIGAEVDVINSRCFCLGVFLKGGIFSNQAEHESALAFSGQNLWDVDDDESELAYLVEAGLGAKWCLSSCFAITAEYRVLWIDGLALAPDQTSATQPPNGAPTARGIDTDGDLLIHGLYLGLDVMF